MWPHSSEEAHRSYAASINDKTLPIAVLLLYSHYYRHSTKTGSHSLSTRLTYLVEHRIAVDLVWPQRQSDDSGVDVPWYLHFEHHALMPSPLYREKSHKPEILSPCL